jgi:hypothetical protein
VLFYTSQLWGFPVDLEIEEGGEVQSTLMVNAQDVDVSLV